MAADRTQEFMETTSAALVRMEDGAEKEDFQRFIKDMQPFAKDAKGQLFQDLWAWWESGLRQSGYFVEFGAATGVSLSNTYLLEKSAHWNGIVAEPNPKFQTSIAANRSCFTTSKCVYSESGKQLAFLAAKYGELSRIADIVPDDGQEKGGRREGAMEVMVDTISLNDLLELAEAPAEIDYMSVDTEGSEFEILSAFDFGKRRIRTLSIEHNKTPMRAKLYDLMIANGYRRRKWEIFTRFDDWYVLAGD